MIRARENAATQRQRAAAGGGKGGKAKGPSERAKQGRSAILEQVDQIQNQIAAKYPGRSIGEVQNYYNSNWGNIPAVIRQAAVEAYGYHRISPRTAQRLAAAGYEVPGAWQRRFPI